MSEVRQKAAAEARDRLVIDYVNDSLAPTSEELRHAEAVYNYVAGILGCENCFKVGSAARGTDIRSSSDMDIMHLIDADENSNSRKALGRLAQTLETALRRSSADSRVNVKTRAVEIESHLPDGGQRFLTDVVPVIESPEKIENLPLCWVPERVSPSAVSAGWHHNNPLYYVNRAKKMDALSKGAFRPAVRLIKSWRAAIASEEDFALKAFHLELIVGEVCLERRINDVVSLTRGFFERLPWYIWHAPLFVDEANPLRFKDGYIAQTGRSAEQMRQKIIRNSTEALDLINELRPGEYPDPDIKRILNELTGT